MLLSTHMFVGGVLGFFLDNTIPGNIYFSLMSVLIFRHHLCVLFRPSRLKGPESESSFSINMVEKRVYTLINLIPKTLVLRFPKCDLFFSHFIILRIVSFQKSNTSGFLDYPFIHLKYDWNILKINTIIQIGV